MKKKTLKALKASIKHWEEDKGVSMDGSDCPLCQRFGLFEYNDDQDRRCIHKSGE
jgi:hypothetical protein|tara:strand:- start:151 stop:315 length:165 start_codon:yes stop_codon:yes gene_type:complete